MRRAKIVATFGPAISTYEQTLAVLEAGVDVARLNMSHGDRSVHEDTYRHVRKAAAELERPVAVFADLQGPRSGSAGSPTVPTTWKWGSGSRSPFGTWKAPRGSAPPPMRGCPGWRWAFPRRPA